MFSGIISKVLGGLLDKYIGRAFRAISDYMKLQGKKREVRKEAERELSAIASIRLELEKIHDKIDAIESAGGKIPPELNKEKKDAEKRLKMAGRNLSSDFFS